MGEFALVYKGKVAIRLLHSYVGSISISGMGHKASLAGPEWLPGELEALLALEPPAEDEVSEDDFLAGPVWDECDGGCRLRLGPRG